MTQLPSSVKLSPLTILLFIIAAISIILNINFYNQLQDQNKVVEVVDGDTFQLSSGKRVRLMGVSSPEYDRCGGSQAKERLSGLILGKSVTLKEETDEAYGRTLALVYVDGTFVNKVMLEEGWGRTDYRKNTQRDILTEAFHKGQTGGLGIFSDLCRKEEVVGDCVIKGNIDKNSYDQFYHLPNCLHYDEVIIEEDIGEGFYCTEEEAISAGFKKAAGCD